MNYRILYCFISQTINTELNIKTHTTCKMTEEDTPQAQIHIQKNVVRKDKFII
jgi:hypothetical protein